MSGIFYGGHPEFSLCDLLRSPFKYDVLCLHLNNLIFVGKLLKEPIDAIIWVSSFLQLWGPLWGGGESLKQVFDWVTEEVKRKVRTLNRRRR